MSDRQTAVVLGVIALILLAPVGVAVAQTLSTHSATAGTQYQTNSGVTVTLGDDRSDIDQVPFDGDTTYADKSLRVSGSDASVEIDDATYGSDPVAIRNVDVSGGGVTVERTDLSRSVTFESGDATLFQLRNYTVGDGAEDFAYASDNGVTVTLDGFDAIGVAAVDTGTGEALDIFSVGPDGEATFELPAGQRSVSLQPTPSELQVRNEANPNELVTGNVSLRARLFAGEETVIERPVTDGTVSLEGVPLDEELVITVREENADFTYRRILLDSAIETSSIYILPTTEPSAEVRFQLRDDTGRFDGEDTRFFVEKPITRDYDGDGTNETRYETISGDRIGADGEFPTILVDAERYRLRVQNDDGEQRVLGSYTVQGARVSPIPIGEVQFESDIEQGAAVQAELREAPDGASYEYDIRLVYLDTDGGTDSIDVSITNSSGGAIRPETTEQINTTAPYVETYPITEPFNAEEDTATVTIDAQQTDGTVETYTRQLGAVPDLNVPIDAQILSMLGVIAIVAVAGLFVILSPPLAALVTPGFAGLLVAVGIVPIPMPAVVLAGLVGVLVNVGRRI